ncbi:hypothetical protein ABK040_000164 [Willaertia magna]
MSYQRKTKLLQSVDNTTFTETTSDDVNIKNDLEKVKLISCGVSHLIIATFSNNVYGQGQNGYHQLGLEGSHSRTEITPIIVNNKNIRSIDHLECGFYHSVFICNSNEIYCAGHSYFGQTFGVRESNHFGKATSDSLTSLNIKENEVITKVSCSTFATLLVIDNWKIISCGDRTALKNKSGYDAGCEIFQTDQIEYCKFGDLKVFVFTKSGKVYTSSPNEVYTLFLEGISKFVVGHMNTKYYYMKLAEEDTIYKGDNIASNKVQINNICTNTGNNFELIATYKPFGLLVNKKTIFTLNEKSYDDDFVLPKLTYEVNNDNYIVNNYISGTANYYILLEEHVTKSQLLMKSLLLKNTKFSDITILINDIIY